MAAAELTEGQSYLIHDQAQLDSDMRANRMYLLNGDRELLMYDGVIRNIEIRHEEIVKHNRQHPENPQADVLDIKQRFLTIRQYAVNINNATRKELHPGS